MLFVDEIVFYLNWMIHHFFFRSMFLKFTIAYRHLCPQLLWYYPFVWSVLVYKWVWPTQNQDYYCMKTLFTYLISTLYHDLRIDRIAYIIAVIYPFAWNRVDRFSNRNKINTRTSAVMLPIIIIYYILNNYIHLTIKRKQKINARR